MSITFAVTLTRNWATGVYLAELMLTTLLIIGRERQRSVTARKSKTGNREEEEKRGKEEEPVGMLVVRTIVVVS